jgi:hypothetical protein
MAINDYKDYHQQRDPRNSNCNENNSATQKTISAARRKYCDQLYEAAGVVSKWEKYQEGQLSLEERKKCLFVWTEDNYQRFRNTEISVGTELLTSNDLVRESVTNYMKWGTELSTTLKNMLRAVKDAKSRMSELRESACKLENCKNDSCNCTQLMLITGKSGEDCKGDPCPPPRNTNPPRDRPRECDNADDLLCDLVCMPRALSFDIDSISQATSEVIGIQVFSNLGNLDPLQKILSERSKAFEGHLLMTTQTRGNDLKKAQDELVKAVQESTKATIGMYSKRSDFESSLRTVDYLCCPDCGCVVTDKNCAPRLQECKCNICDICDDVKETFCSDNSEQRAAY